MQIYELPLDPIGPVSGTHLALGYVLGVPRLESLTSTSVCIRLTLLLWRAGYTLLSKSNQFGLIPLLGEYHVRLGGVRRSSLGLVNPGEAVLVKQ